MRGMKRGRGRPRKNPVLSVGDELMLLARQEAHRRRAATVAIAAMSRKKAATQDSDAESETKSKETETPRTATSRGRGRGNMGKKSGNDRSSTSKGGKNGVHAAGIKKPNTYISRFKNDHPELTMRERSELARRGRGRPPKKGGREKSRVLSDSTSSDEETDAESVDDADNRNSDDDSKTLEILSFVAALADVTKPAERKRFTGKLPHIFSFASGLPTLLHVPPPKPAEPPATEEAQATQDGATTDGGELKISDSTPKNGENGDVEMADPEPPRHEPLTLLDTQQRLVATLEELRTLRAQKHDLLLFNARNSAAVAEREALFLSEIDALSEKLAARAAPQVENDPQQQPHQQHNSEVCGACRERNVQSSIIESEIEIWNKIDGGVAAIEPGLAGTGEHGGISLLDAALLAPILTRPTVETSDRSEYSGNISLGSAPRSGGINVRVIKLKTQAVTGTANLLTFLPVCLHPSISPILGVSFDEENFYVVYPEHGWRRLDAVLRGPAPLSLLWSLRLNIAREIVSGLRFLHSGDAHSARPPALHRNLNGDTVLVDADGRVSLTGLENLVVSPGGSYSVPYISNKIGYVDPELLSSPRYFPRHDLYSVGVIFLQILTGSSAVEDAAQIPTLVRRVLDRNYRVDPKFADPIAQWPAPIFNDFARLCENLVSPEPTPQDILAGFTPRRTAGEVLAALDEIFARAKVTIESHFPASQISTFCHASPIQAR